MIRILLLSSMIALLTPGQTRAQDPCDAILALAQVQQALERVSAPGHRRVSADMDFIRRILLRADAANVNFALRDHALSTQSEAITEFLTLARSVSDEYANGRQNRALNFLLTEGPSQINRSTGMMLRGYPCFQSSDRQLRGLQQLEPGNDIEQIAVGGFTRARVITSLVLSIIMIPVFVTLIFYQARRMQLRNRKEKRHYLEMPAKLVPSQARRDLANTDLWQHITIEDLSCNGAKISPGSAVPEDAQTSVTLLIDTTQHAATVKWSNQHFAGVKFEKPLDIGLVKRMTNLHPPTGEVGSPTVPANPPVVIRP